MSDAAQQDGSAIWGRAIHAPVRGAVEVLEDALILVDAAGTIRAVRAGVGAADPELAHLRADGRLTALRPDEVLIPGLVDLHVHAPQFPQAGMGLDLPLEEWLLRYTFPLEERFADLDFANSVYEDLVATLLAHGTTTALYFATIHLPATQRLAEICLKAGQRALVGRVAMDNPEHCPSSYRDASTAQAIADTKRLIDFIRAMPGNEAGRVLPVVTPRFLPTCTDPLLEGLGALAQAEGCHVQTHCSECDWAHSYALGRAGRTDTSVLAGYGLVGRRTVLAHSNFIDADDVGIIRAAGAAVAHCPLSNAFFACAVFPLREHLDAGIHIGLGSDIAGGPSASVFDQARMAVVASRMLESGTDPAKSEQERGRAGARVDALTAFRLATAGGGEALDLPVGLFRPGFAFDAVALQSGLADGNLRFQASDSGATLIERLVMSAGRGDIARVWVGGSLVRSR